MIPGMSRNLLAFLLACCASGCDDADPPRGTSKLDALVSGGALPPDGIVARDAVIDAVVDAVVDAAQDQGVDACRPDCTGRECGNDGCGGGCGLCPSDEFCSAAGICAREGCRDGRVRCGEICVDVMTEVTHCGDCGEPCLTPEGARVRCEAGACIYVCLAADGAPDEVDPLTDRRHCGACGRVCPEACDEGGCVPADCREIIEEVVTCLAGNAACPGVPLEEADRIRREGRALCDAPGLFGLVRQAVAAGDCATVIELAGDVWCFPSE